MKVSENIEYLDLYNGNNNSISHRAYTSWVKEDGEVNWCEYMLYPRAKDSDYPMMLAYKYFNDEENDKEVERRMKYERGK